MSSSPTAVFGTFLYESDRHFQYLQLGWCWAMHHTGGPLSEQGVTKVLGQSPQEWVQQYYETVELPSGTTISLDDLCSYDGFQKLQGAMKSQKADASSIAVVRLGVTAALVLMKKITPHEERAKLIRLATNILSSETSIRLGTPENAIKILETSESKVPGQLNWYIVDRQEGKGMKNINLLLASAVPVGLTHISGDAELRNISEVIQASEFRDNVTIKMMVAPRWVDFSTQLLRFKPNILHFAGHGNSCGGILVENDEGDGYTTVKPSILAGLLAKSVEDGDISGVILNCCYSNSAQEVARSVPSLIAMEGPVGDKVALNFAENFYRALTEGKGFRNAFEWAMTFTEKDHSFNPHIYIGGRLMDRSELSEITTH